MGEPSEERGADGARSPIRVSVVGATGYTGGELVRWLLGHPRVEVVHLTSRRWAERPLPEAWPALRGLEERTLVEPDPEVLASSSDVVMLAVPHGAGMGLAPPLLDRGVRVVDLSADFRLGDADLYREWYGRDHAAPELLSEAVYGLPEIHRDAVAGARLVANPGCYPTATVLALLPLARAGVVEGPVSVDAKSGASGAGRAPADHTTYVEVQENVLPYGVGRHRHTPEIEGVLEEAGFGEGIFFTPQLVPMSRGILAACHVRLSRRVEPGEALEIYGDAYGDEPFVRVLDDELPRTRATVGSNFCDVTVRVDPERRIGVALAALDNLGKGAASQAVQNLNRMFDLDEREGLWHAPTFP